MTADQHRLLQAMADALPPMLDPEAVTQASFALMCLALSEMDDAKHRDRLVASLSTEARKRIQTLMAERDKPLGEHLH